MDEVLAKRAIVELLSRVSAEIGVTLELHPQFQQPCTGAASPDFGFKVHVREASPDRVLAVIVSPFDVHDSGHFAGYTERLIRDGLREFYLEKPTERFACLDTTKPVRRA